MWNNWPDVIRYLSIQCLCMWKLCFMTSLVCFHLYVKSSFMGQQWGGSECLHTRVQYTHIVCLCVCVCIEISVSICSHLFIWVRGLYVSIHMCVSFERLMYACVCAAGRKCSRGLGPTQGLAVNSGLPFVLSVGMYSLRRKAWLEHSPTVQWHLFFSLAFRQTDRAMGDSET